ncbi:MAG: BspA family leucine-rich repeat surface protein [Bacteroidales bacterium]|nr:BspA family leucine-rich repeat surface protein [Bacteroidales bacterium]
MRKITFFLALICLMLLNVAANAQEAYVTVKDGVATFKFDSKKATGDYPIRDGVTDSRWPSDVCSSITKVVFDASFKSYTPVMCTGWFSGFVNLTEVVGINENFNSSKVYWYYYMFSGCRSLKTLDLSGLNTSSAANMVNMFAGCDNIQAIYVGEGWNTDNVTSSNGMFDYCNKLYGGKGTSVKVLKKYDKTYAKIDDGTNKGYFTKVGDPIFYPERPYIVIKDGVATYSYSNAQVEGAYFLDEFDHSSGNNYKVAQTITKVVFDKSFKNYKPTSLSKLFSSFRELVEISGMENLNTENVTEMQYMFNACAKLASLDLSSFNTAKVTTMYCMFDGCESLKSLDLSSFNTQNVTDMHRMFYNCDNLVTVFVKDKDWTTKFVTKSDDMFFSCEKLCGGQGTTVASKEVYDATYARIDFGEEEPGYFTRSGDPVYDPTHPYITISNGKATFYYNATAPANAKPLQTTMLEGKWTQEEREKITEVSFDESFKNYKPTSCAYWFYNFVNLSKIYNIKFLNTENVTDMGSMFYCCEKLGNIDLSGFNTSNVQYMSDMFVNCTSLVTLDLSSFDTKKVTSMASMFNNCANLKTIYVSEKWNTSAVKDYKSIFNLCKKLYGGKGTHCTESDIKYAQIDGGKDNPGYLTKSGEAGFEAPLTYAKFDSETGVLTLGYSKTLPDGAKEINAEKTTSEVWIASEVTEAKNVKKIIIDKSFADFEPTSCYYWFYNCANVEEISGLENINTENVTDMRYMFYSNKVTILDLRSFNTANVRDMYEMFMGCSDLKTILVSDKWTTEKVEVSGAMFRFCSKLEGMNGTKYSDDTDATVGLSYAKIDGGKDNPGYFSSLKAVSLEITTAPKTEYKDGEDFSAENGVLTIKYNNNLAEAIDLSKAEITGFDKTKAGEQTLKVTYSGLSTELKVTVKENVPTPVSEIIPASGVKVWSYNGVIFIESERSGLEYKIVDLGGRTLKTSTTKSDKEEIRLNANGIVIVLLKGKSYKVMAK